MKKITILLAAILLLFIAIPNQGISQENHGSNSPRFGIKGGVNFSNLYTNDNSEASMLTGYHFGLLCKVPITRIVAIQPELYLTTKGAEVKYNSLFIDGTASFKLNYLEMPLLIVVNITPNFNIHFGPYGAFLINGKARNVSNISLFNFEQNIDTHDYNRWDAGIAVGAGIDLGALSIGARYNYGLTNVGTEKTFMGITYLVPDANNGVINIYLSLSLN